MESTSPIKIERIVAGGWGLTHMGSKVTFVRGVLPDEMVTVTPNDFRRGYQFATLDHIQDVSPDRITPPCEKYAQCGGCQFQHIRYDAQLRLKQLMLEEAFSRIGQVPVREFLPPIPSPFPYEYRRWVRFAVFQNHQTFHLGFLQERSHKAVEATSCLLFPESIKVVVEELNARLGALSRLPAFLSSVEIRASAAFGNHLLILKSPKLHQGQAETILGTFQGMSTVTGQVISSSVPPSRRIRRPVRLVYGDDHVFEQFHDTTFRISDRSFMQANWSVYAMIFQTMDAWLGEYTGMRVLELYAGIGCLGLSLAKRGALVTMVEENPHAIGDARKTASLNHLGRCRFRASTAENFLNQVQPHEYDLVLVDPPRTGLSKSCVDLLIRVQAQRVLYVSCDAASLARDAKRLGAAGYHIGRVQLFDMFPQTAHIETLVEFFLR